MFFLVQIQLFFLLKKKFPSNFQFTKLRVKKQTPILGRPLILVKFGRSTLL